MTEPMAPERLAAIRESLDGATLSSFRVGGQAREDMLALLDHIEKLTGRLDHAEFRATEAEWQLAAESTHQDDGPCAVCDHLANVDIAKIYDENEILRRDLHTAKAEREHALGIARLLRQERNVLRREVDDAGRARAALDRVRAEHGATPWPDGSLVCSGCGRLWPCPTLRALEGDAS
ncbi:hypothetical protein EDD28_0033 [Salana multivorans]|uniref:Uncharacterized protein n=1 Tax=Salana multivorans TaxID=120377 RepID=A0A3N2D6S4_9MICO|nr:hypothetical protein [Salana multivorans]ROR95480.1 hypothetical protein EDD28_0033 [Salana multivorans]